MLEAGGGVSAGEVPDAMKRILEREGRRGDAGGGGGGGKARRTMLVEAQWKQEGLMRVEAPGLAVIEGAAVPLEVRNVSAVLRDEFTVVPKSEAVGGGGGGVLFMRPFEIMLWGTVGAVVDLLSFVVIIYGGPTVLQVAGCMKMAAYTILTVSLAGESELPGEARAFSLAGALSGAWLLVAYMRRWLAGWGAMPVPVPSLTMGAVMELEHTLSRQLGNEMGKIGSAAAAAAGGDAGKHHDGMPLETPGSAIS